MSLQTRFLLLYAGFFLLEFYFYQGFKNIFTNTLLRRLHWVLIALIYGTLLYFMFSFDRESRKITTIHWITSLFLIFLVPKLLGAIFLLVDDVFRFFQFFTQKYITHSQDFYPERRKFLSVMALGSAAAMSGLVLDGVWNGKYRHTVRNVKLKFKNLPNSFIGYKILQISDVHSGSFIEPRRIEKIIDLINEQNADLVLFTGDMVNNYADEFLPFVEMFGRISSKDGKYSVLGNHDYGSYGIWKSKAEKAKNVPNLIEYQKRAGFEVLRNEHRVIEKNGEKIYLLGVENWGEKPFPQIGDLDKTVAGIPQDAVKVLMSHDPTHFDRKVKMHPANVQLTLSGHTHGMQFGLDLKNIRWSPVQFRYKKWADLYESEGKYLYVNRGFGVIGFPGRVGVLPEITVIEMQKG